VVDAQPVPPGAIPTAAASVPLRAANARPLRQPLLGPGVQLAAGLDGVERKLTPPDPVNKNIFEMSFRERRKYRIDEAAARTSTKRWNMLEKDDVVRDALGSHIYERSWRPSVRNGRSTSAA